MPPTKWKHGERVSVFLSNEALDKARYLSGNRSGLIEALILKAWDECMTREMEAKHLRRRTY